MSQSDKTEKATPKKKEDARKKGQVAKSMDFNGAWVLICALFTLSLVGPWMWDQVGQSMREFFALISTPSVVEREGIGELLTAMGKTTAVVIAPIAGVCMIAGMLASVVQVGLKPMPEALKPDPKRLNPLSGFKNIFGKRMIFESGKNVAKVTVVGASAAIALFPKIDELASTVGMPAGELLVTLCKTTIGVCQRAAAAYLLIGVIDLIYQRWHHEKNLRMDHQEIKDEMKQQDVNQEIRMARKRRQMEAAARRMMDEVPTADVVVMNPTHFAVALKYDTKHPAPVCVAKGQDLMALRIRDIARDAGVTVVEEPPLARSLHAAVDVGHMIPEELFQAVAQLLAYVYRVAGVQRAG